MRLKENIKLSKSCTGDTITVLTFDDGNDTPVENIPIRVLAIDLGNGTTEYLATNMFSSEYSPSDFKELYFLRWGLELKYGELKTQLLL